LGNLIWLASYPKSGSTWLRAFLHNYLRDTAAPHPINSLMDITTGESGTSLYRPYNATPPTTWTPADVQRMRPRVHQDLTQLHPGPIFVKTHNALARIAGAPLITPRVTAAAICIVRDPRDIAMSYSRHLALSLDDTIAFMARPDAATGGTEHEVYEYLGPWSAHVDSWTNRVDPRLHMLRYEDLIEDPLPRFAGLIRFLGQEPDPDRLARAVAHSSFATLQSQEQESGFIERPAGATAPFFRAGRAGQWRDALTVAQRRRIEADHLPTMARLGYLF
jgi:Sulfotransferase domain